MAYDDDVSMLGDDSLFMPGPMEQQQALARQVRKNPALVMPTSGVQPPKPAQPAPMSGGSAPGAAVGTPSQTDLMRQIVERMGQRPDPQQYVEHARERGEGANRKLMLALTLGAKGGESLAPFGQQLSAQALKESGDYEIPGGWGTVSPSGKVAWNTAKQQEADLARLTKLYDIESGEETKRLTARTAADTRAEARAQRLASARTDDERAALALRWRTEDQMQKQYEASTKTFREELDATRKVAQLAPTMIGRRPNAIEQQSLMVLLNKFLDPGSVVREGEFDRVARAQGYLDRAANLMQYIARGEPLSDKLIAEIVGMSQFYEKASTAKLHQIGDEMTRKARGRGLDPANVIIDPYYTPSERRGAPPGGGQQTGRGTADAPIRVQPRAPGGAAPRQGVVDVDF